METGSGGRRALSSVTAASDAFPAPTMMAISRAASQRSEPVSKMMNCSASTAAGAGRMMPGRVA